MIIMSQQLSADPEAEHFVFVSVAIGRLREQRAGLPKYEHRTAINIVLEYYRPMFD